MKLAFSIAWLIKILKFYLEEQILIKYYVTKHLTLIEIKKTMNNNVELHQWFIGFLIKSILLVPLFKINNSLKNYASQLLENLRNVYSSFKDNIWVLILWNAINK